MTIRLARHSPTCTEVKLHEHTLYFSYDTLVACQNNQGTFKLDRYFSATTQRHLNKMCVYGATPLDERSFNEMVHLTLKKAGR